MNEMAQGHMNELLYYKKDGKTLTFIREDLRGCLTQGCSGKRNRKHIIIRDLLL